MTSISNELFLFVCVKHSNGGKINFPEVAKECGIKKNAAYMRWSRFTEKLDTSALNNATAAGNVSDAENESTGVGTPRKTPKKQSAKKTPTKKRKLNEHTVDDEEGAATVKAEED